MKPHHLLGLGLASATVAALLTGCATSGGATARPSGRPASTAPSLAATAAAPTDEALQAALAQLEKRYGARLGIEAIDTGDGRHVSYRANERFAFASTDKTFLAAAVLRSSSDHDLEKVVHYSSDDLLEYAPITSKHVEDGMTVRALLDAALRYSDNTAANLLVEHVGGPAAVERFLRSVGDRTTSVDRIEPDLNTAIPGDRRDTTTPRAFATDLDRVLLGTALPDSRRRTLDASMRHNTTGGPYIRAGVPASWTVADKTGSGSYGTRNDIAVVTPPHRAPIVLVLLSHRGSEEAVSQDALLADATEAVVPAFER